ncbi:hypothetical protein JCM8097_009336 [Rhodosporidiobolus ruineniae]
MATVAAIPIPPHSPLDDRHTPVLSTISAAFSPSSLHLQPYTNPRASGSPASTHSSSGSPVGYAGGASPRLGGGSPAVPMGSRFEKPPHEGPGTAEYVRQPSRAQLRENNSVFGSANRPFYYKDPLGKPFIDADGKECGPRWIYVDPKGRSEGGSFTEEDSRAAKNGCCIM